jgi:hypothetical protein
LAFKANGLAILVSLVCIRIRLGRISSCSSSLLLFGDKTLAVTVPFYQTSLKEEGKVQCLCPKPHLFGQSSTGSTSTQLAPETNPFGTFPIGELIVFQSF